MKVVLVPSAVDLAGVSTHVLNLASLLHEERMLDLGVCPSDGWLPRTLGDRGLPHAIVPLSYRPTRFIASSLSLQRFLRSRRSADIVHVHGRFPMLLAATSFGHQPLRVAATVHQFDHPDRKGLLGWKSTLETSALRRARRICCVSEDLKVETLSRIGREHAGRVDVIPNWIEPLWHGRARPDPRPRPTRDGRPAVRICAVGRLSREKGFDVLVSSVGILTRQGYPVACDIFGEGPEEPALRRLAAAAGLSDHVHLEAPSGDVRLRLPEYDLLVIPSRSESFGIVALEAYDASIPVIASDVAGLRRTVLRGKTGLLFEPGNSTSLADAITRLARSESLARELVANATTYLELYLPNDRLREEYQDFYRKALLDKP